MECLPFSKKMEMQFKRLSPCTSTKNDLIVFKKSELAEATNNFSPSNKIGQDDSGSVYRGIIKSKQDAGKQIYVAICDLTRIFLHRKHDKWITEINAIGVVEHPNLVKLIGYCTEYHDGKSDENQRFLVHEFMCNGSVHDHLENRFHTTLSWAQRLRIARQVAHGLEYLHEQVEDEIPYRIFKSSIVLLDEEWNAKLSDFVLGRLGPFPYTHPKNWCVLDSHDFQGTKPLDSVSAFSVTCMNDVWSYGVFIFQLITGRRHHVRTTKLPVNEGRLPVPIKERKRRLLAFWVKPHLSDIKDFQLIMDPRLEGKYSLQSAWELAAVAKLCLTKDPEARPKMSEISTILDKMVEAAEF